MHGNTAQAAVVVVAVRVVVVVVAAEVATVVAATVAAAMVAAAAVQAAAVCQARRLLADASSCYEHTAVVLVPTSVSHFLHGRAAWWHHGRVCVWTASCLSLQQQQHCCSLVVAASPISTPGPAA